MKPALARTFRALRYRNFRLFFVGQGLSVMGTWLQQVAMGWLTYRLSGSAWLLGVVAFCGSAGILFFGTFAGVVADHVHRRRALRVTQSLALVQAVVLAALTWSGLVAVWHLIVLALWLGMVSAFDVPLRQSLWVHLVDDRADLPNAIALNSFLVNAARVVGPAIAGLLLAVASEAVCFALNALSFVAVIVAISRMRWPREPGPEPWHGGFWAKWVEGYRFVSGFAPARALLLLVAALSWTISPYSSLMPVYAKDIFGGGPQTLGFLLAAAGAGALASTLYLASRATVRGLGRVIAGAALACGLALAAFAYVPVFPLALVLMFARRRRRDPGRGGGEHHPADDRTRRPARPRRRLLHARVPRHGPARQSRCRRAGERGRRAVDVRGERTARGDRGARVLARAADAARADAADVRAARDRRRRHLNRRAARAGAAAGCAHFLASQVDQRVPDV